MPSRAIHLAKNQNKKQKVRSTNYILEASKLHMGGPHAVAGYDISRYPRRLCMHNCPTLDGNGACTIVVHFVKSSLSPSTPGMRVRIPSGTGYPGTVPGYRLLCPGPGGYPYLPGRAGTRLAVSTQASRDTMSWYQVVVPVGTT